MLSLALALQVYAAAGGCITTLKELKNAKVHATWVETTMDDGKPLTISIYEKDAKLRFIARKVGAEWLNGEVCVSKDGKNLTLQNTTATKNVPFAARQVLPSQQEGKIENGRVTFGGIAWSGTFKGH